MNVGIVPPRPSAPRGDSSLPRVVPRPRGLSTEGQQTGHGSLARAVGHTDLSSRSCAAPRRAVRYRFRAKSTPALLGAHPFPLRFFRCASFFVRYFAGVLAFTARYIVSRTKRTGLARRRFRILKAFVAMCNSAHFLPNEEQ